MSYGEVACSSPSIAMASSTEHTHHIRINPAQMEMKAPQASGRGNEDYDRKLKEAQDELERIQQQRQELERQKQELEEINARKRAFISQHAELTEKLGSAITLIDRQLVEMRGEAEELEQCRASFAAHLSRLGKFNPESWTRENIVEKLDRASQCVDHAADEYDQCAAHFENTRSGSIFGRAGQRARKQGRAVSGGDFFENARNGLAFNFPIIVLGGLALIAYLVK